MVMGGIVPVVHLNGVKADGLALDGKTLADIFLGKVKTWNDPEIAKLNPGVTLPATAIAVIHRADGSGTTFNFTYYLAEASPEWKDKVGVSTAVDWPTGIGAKGNDGVANNVAGAEGAIGYVEYAYAKQNKLAWTDMINKAGKKVEPTMEAFQAAAANADWDHAPGFYLILANQPGDKSWPMTAATFILMYKNPVDVKASDEALKFFGWCYKNGAKDAEALDYIPMPQNVVEKVEKMWASDIKQK
jgi:phosphate transport system substrate-binding protein